MEVKPAIASGTDLILGRIKWLSLLKHSLEVQQGNTKDISPSE